MTRKLVPEQLFALTIYLKYAKSIRRNMKNPLFQPDAPRLIIHGGAGKLSLLKRISKFLKFYNLIIGSGKSSITRVISLWVEKNLRVHGKDPDKPRVLLCAPTGMSYILR